MTALHQDGHVFPVELTVCPMRIDGRYIFSGFLRDISQRIKDEIALRDSESRFRQLAENIREVFWMFDLRRDKYIYISPA